MNEWITIKEITGIKEHYSGKAWVLKGRGRSDLRGEVDFLHISEDKRELESLSIGDTFDQRV